MSCGKRPLIKNWDKPKKIRVVSPSRYEQNEASVKQHWKNVIKSIELSYKDDQVVSMSRLLFNNPLPLWCSYHYYLVFVYYIIYFESI